MKRNKRDLLFVSALCLGTTASVEAALVSTAVLNFDAPVYDANGLVVAGSSFGVDFTGDGVVDITERTGLTVNDGLILGVVQPGSPAAPGIDQPWQFFANPGIHLTTSPVTILSDDGAGNVELDFSVWSVNCNGLDIGLGGAAWGSNPDVVAQLSCQTDCSTGDSFSLFYTAQVTDGPFTGVRYRLGFDSGNLSFLAAETVTGGPIEDPGVIATGTIGASVVPVPAAIWLFGSGLIGLIGVARKKKP